MYKTLVLYCIVLSYIKAIISFENHMRHEATNTLTQKVGIFYIPMLFADEMRMTHGKKGELILVYTYKKRGTIAGQRSHSDARRDNSSPILSSSTLLLISFAHYM